jgi:hypothetical protein
MITTHQKMKIEKRDASRPSPPLYVLPLSAEITEVPISFYVSVHLLPHIPFLVLHFHICCNYFKRIHLPPENISETNLDFKTVDLVTNFL